MVIIPGTHRQLCERSSSGHASIVPASHRHLCAPGPVPQLGRPPIQRRFAQDSANRRAAAQRDIHGEEKGLADSNLQSFRLCSTVMAGNLDARSLMP